MMLVQPRVCVQRFIRWGRAVLRSAAVFGVAGGLIAGAAVAQTFELKGEKQLIAVTKDGQRTRIGSVTFEPVAASAGSTRFDVKMDHAVLRDYFLSMREFKCLPAAEEVSCHVPYPYQQPGTVTPDNFVWLEHSLLFLFKRPSEFGAKLWNGVIYQFERTATGLVGQPQAVDLNHISAPPDNLDVPPYGKLDRGEYAPGARWIAELRIE
jgi:hypothetical protein